MRRVALALAVVLFPAVCVSAGVRPFAPAPLQLAGTRWRFVRVAGHELPPAVEASLVFESNGHVSGRAGCNGYGGPWMATRGALRFGGMLSTKMACLEPAGAMQTEQAVFAALRDTEHARMREGRLILLDANGAPLATLRAQGGSQ